MSSLRAPGRRHAAFLAIFALALQLVLPGLHVCEAHDVGAGHGVAAQGVAVSQRHDADHDSATCPICNAIASARGATTATVVYVAPPALAVSETPRTPRESPVRTPDLTAAAPRGPPADLAR